MSSPAETFAVVVTYNRQALLARCLDALEGQSVPPGCILVIDNASTDDTAAFLARRAQPGGRIAYRRMPANLGGAGGFAEGIRQATVAGAGWIWLMDDDAEPHPDALERLIAVARDSGQVYGSLAVCGADTAWPITLQGPDGGTVSRADAVPACAPVSFVPFLGFLIHRQLVERIGLPDAEFFIAADDVEYSLRARRAGAGLWIAGGSRIEHPRAQTWRFGLPGLALLCRRLPPWKNYYDTRNKLLIARRYHGWRVWTHTLPGLLVRMVATLVGEPRRGEQLRAFAAGLADGMRGRAGCRHTSWRIR